MKNYDAFYEQVALKFQIYNGLFLNLPFEQVKPAAIMLPMFADFCRERLEAGEHPAGIIEAFAEEKLDDTSFDELKNLLFTFMQIVERQVVLFDALEDAAYGDVEDTDGAGSVRELLTRLEAESILGAYERQLEDYCVRVVLTAHPTQFYPDEVLAIITDLGDALRADDLRGIHRMLLQLGMTRFMNKEKPTPLDEAQSLLWFLEHVFYHTVAGIQRRLVEPIAGDDRERLITERPKIELGFWPGGDRDGNPFVTSELTIATANRLRTSLLRLYLGDVRRLLRRLTFPGVHEAMERVRDRLNVTLYPLIRVQQVDYTAQGDWEDASEDAYDAAEELLDELDDVRTRLYREHMGLFAEELEDLMLKVRIFGFHFASMDLRQDSRVHTSVIADIIAALERDSEDGAVRDGSRASTAYDEAGVEERMALLEKFTRTLPCGGDILEQVAGDMTRDTVLSVRAARAIQRTNGPRGMHRYIISNTRSAADVLEVWFLTRCALPDGETIDLDIVPLFETVNDLGNAYGIMRALYSHRTYQEHLSRRGNTQYIMLGFSDGTKDGGYVTANWEIYRTKQRLTELARERGIRVVFFDGRGGPPARGGGNTYKFYRAMGRAVENREIHLTIQGQTVSSKFGTYESARHNLEQLVTSGLENQLYPEQGSTLTREDEELLQEISEAAHRHYRALREDEKLIPYLERMTPLRFYGLTNIASRPTSRSSQGRLSLENLRAIPFVGAWSQLKQNIPGYFGFGSALNEQIEAGHLERLSWLYEQSLFFRTLVENTRQSLSKTYYPLTSYLEHDSEFGDFWRRLRDEAELTRRTFARISGSRELMATDPSMRDSIRTREEIVLPVLVIQQYALSKLRELGDGTPAPVGAGAADDAGAGTAAGAGPADAGELRGVFEKMVVKSLPIIVNSARNAV
ncbi:MAG: phosphoenolpyruvate carboxylase [Spirochaetota bacterium]